MKIFQIVNGVCKWQTPYNTVQETYNLYPADLLFVEAPDYVMEGWTYKVYDDKGNALVGENRFFKPIPEEGYFYDDLLGIVKPDREYKETLTRDMNIKQEENKLAFNNFLKDNPLIYKDGKKYGVTLEDQSEIQLNLSQYKLQVAAGVSDPVLEWHASHEACVAWTEEDLTKLALAISNYVYPYFTKMQEYKTRIYESIDLEEVQAIKIVYE